MTVAVPPNLDLAMSFAWQKNGQTPNERKQDFPDVLNVARSLLICVNDYFEKSAIIIFI